MKLTHCIALSALIAATAVRAEVPAPTPIQREGSCPSNYSSQGNFCVPSNGAKFAMLKLGGSCPSNYTSSGAYCVADHGAKLAIPNPERRSCPSSYTSSGYYCVAPN